MKRSAFAATFALVLAGMASKAGAVTLNPNGLGQALIYPYYTVNQGQDTLFTLDNTSDLGQVARVRFHEGYNGRVVLDVLVFLSPHDTWTAAVTAAAAADGAGAKLVTADRSCTIPAIPAAGLPFDSANYDGHGVAPYNQADSGPQTIARTREGHVDVVANGHIVPDSPTDLRVRHAQVGMPGAGTPAGCAALQLANVWPDILVTPTNTLGGAIGIVNVSQGTYFPYDAVALSNFTQVPLTGASATADYDDLSRANSAGGGATATVFTDEGAVALRFAQGIDAVSAVLMADSVHNDVLVNPAIGAATDWVLTFPTKRYYVDGQAFEGTPRAPFNTRFANGESAVTIGYKLYDNEELYVSDPCGPICGTPPPQSPLTPPYEVNVVALRQSTVAAPSTSGALGSRLTRNLLATFPGWTSGQADLDLAVDDRQVLATGVDAAGTSTTLFGLPVAGFMAYNIVNVQAQAGQLANYSGVFAHRKRSHCIVGAPSSAPPLACE